MNIIHELVFIMLILFIVLVLNYDVVMHFIYFLNQNSYFSVIVFELAFFSYSKSKVLFIYLGKNNYAVQYNIVVQKFLML